MGGKNFKKTNKPRENFIKYFFYLGTIQIRRQSKLSNFQDPLPPLVHLRLKSFHPLDLEHPISNELPPTTLSNKLWNSKRTMHVNEQIQNKNKTKSRHIQIDHAFYCSIYPTNSAMVSWKDGFTVWRQSQKEDFLWIIY